MNKGGKNWIHDRYADVLREGDDESVVRVVRDLDLAYQLGDLPLGSKAPQREDLRRRRFQTPVRRRVWKRRLGLTGALLLAASAVIGVAVAATSILNLGKPTNDLPSSYLPIGGFHHVPITLEQKGKPVVLLMGTALDYQTAVMRWPLVKALQQFGAFVGAKPALQKCDYSHPQTPIPSGQYGIPLPEPCGPPTFDLTKASYHSAYVAFRQDDLLDQRQKVHVRSLPPAERRIYDSYARSHVSNNEAENIAASVVGITNSTSSKRLPLLLIGHYLQTVDQSITPEDFGIQYVPGSVTKSDNPVPYLSFQQTEAGLRVGKIPRKMGNVLYEDNEAVVHDVNIDANLFTALICRADGLKPKRVCARPTIRRLLRHVK